MRILLAAARDVHDGATNEGGSGPSLARGGGERAWQGPAAALPAPGGIPKRRPERFMAKDLMMIKELAAVSA